MFFFEVSLDAIKKDLTLDTLIKVFNIYVTAVYPSPLKDSLSCSMILLNLFINFPYSGIMQLIFRLLTYIFTSMNFSTGACGKVL